MCVYIYIYIDMHTYVAETWEKGDVVEGFSDLGLRVVSLPLEALGMLGPCLEPCNNAGPTHCGNPFQDYWVQSWVSLPPPSTLPPPRFQVT